MIDWPAQRLSQVAGDVFGNDAVYLWRCDECGGYFEHPEPHLVMGHVVGMIAMDALEEFKAALIEAAQKARLLVATEPCTCGYHHERPRLGFTLDP